MSLSIIIPDEHSTLTYSNIYKKKQYPILEDLSTWRTTVYQIWIENGQENMAYDDISWKIKCLCSDLKFCIFVKDFSVDSSNRLEATKKSIIEAVRLLSKSKKDLLVSDLRNMVDSLNNFLVEKKIYKESRILF